MGVKDIRSWLLVLVSPCVSVIAFPEILNDGANLAKFLVLGIFSCGLLALLISNRRSLNLHKYRLPLISVGLFAVSLLNPILFSGSPIELQLYGTYGRNTGLLTHIFLLIVFVSALTLSKEINIKRAISSLIIAGSFETFYAILQIMKADPISWGNRDGWIFGTFFNPNFLSAFLGIASSSILLVILTWNLNIGLKILLLADALLMIFVIIKSESVQGIFTFVASIAVVIFLYIRKFFDSKYLSYGYVLFVGISIFIAILGLLQKGPLRTYLYQESISFRGDYWKAAFKAFTHNPITGVGLDSFGNWYSFYRSSIAATRHGPDIVTNSAHNIFLDYAASGGIFLLCSYLLLCFLVIRSIIVIARGS